MNRPIRPQLATLVDAPPTGDEWLHEIKLDGYRMLAYVNKKDVKLISRNNNDYSTKFQNVIAALKKLNLEDSIIDGEIVILNEQGKSDFQLLQNAVADEEETNFYYYVFDILKYKGKDLYSLPLIERKKILHKIIPSSTGKDIRYNDHIIGAGKELFKKTCALGLEGIVSKLADSVYTQGRTRNWLKAKCSNRQEFVIGGFTQPQKSRERFGALLLGFYDKKKLRYCGRVGTGFNDRSLKAIHEELQNHISTRMPFATTPPDSKGVTWLDPVLIAEVEYKSMTRDGILRQASFKGMRTDKSSKSITLDKPVSTKTTMKITNPDKVLYKEENVTKIQVVEYYKGIQKYILPYIINRPLSLYRCPEGYDKECFFQKHIPHAYPEGLYKIPIKEKSKKADYIYIKNGVGLTALAQLGTLEIHPWGSTIKDVDLPDTLIFDLDPAPDVPWSKVVKAAIDLRAYLKELKLKSFVKSTGGKGLHVVVPIKPEYDWDSIKIFARTFVEYIVSQRPDEFISKMTKIRRVGKIYLDYLRNQRGATAVAPYSLRARKEATVAVPLAWDELSNDKEENTYTIKTIFERMDSLRHDPWKDYFKTKQSLDLDKLLEE